MTPSTVLEILWRTAKWIRPEYDNILERVRAADVVYTDETGLKVGGRQFVFGFSQQKLKPYSPLGGAGGRRF